MSEDSPQSNIDIIQAPDLDKAQRLKEAGELDDGQLIYLDDIYQKLLDNDVLSAEEKVFLDQFNDYQEPVLASSEPSPIDAETQDTPALEDSANKEQAQSNSWASEHIDDRTERKIAEAESRISEINMIIANPDGYDDNALQELEKEKSDLIYLAAFHRRRLKPQVENIGSQEANESEQEDQTNPPATNKEDLSDVKGKELEPYEEKSKELEKSRSKELEPYEEQSKELERFQETDEAEQQPSPEEESSESEHKLSLGSLKVGDVATRIREAAERDLMEFVNTGGVLKRTWRKITRLNQLVREPWLQRRQAALAEQIEGKGIEDLYGTLSSLDSDAGRTASNELVIALLDDSGLARTESEESNRRIGTGNEELDTKIRQDLKGIVSEFLEIKNPSPQQIAEYKDRIGQYMEQIANDNPDILGLDKENNFLGFGGEELIMEAARLRDTLITSMDHEDAMERVQASLDNLELVFGQMQSGANGELAHTKFNDTMERLRSSDTKLGNMVRKHRGFAAAAAIGFTASVATAKFAPSTGARILAVTTLGVGAAGSAYFARQQARARSETDTSLANILAGSAVEVGQDGEYAITADEGMRTRQYETATYNETVDLFSEFIDVSEQDGTLTINDNLTNQQLQQMAEYYAAARARLDLHRTTGANLYSTVKGQSIKAGLNRLSKVLNTVGSHLEQIDSTTQFDIDGEQVSAKSYAIATETIRKTELAETMKNIDEANETRRNREGRMAAGFALGGVAVGTLAAAELSSVVAGRGLQNPTKLAQAYFRPSLDSSSMSAGAPPEIPAIPDQSETTTIGSTTITAPEGSKFTINGNTATYTTPEGTTVNNLTLGNNGELTPEAEEALKQAGFNTEQVSTTQAESVAKTMTAEALINTSGGEPTPTVNWLDNGTPAPNFDGTELGQYYSLNSSGDIVITQGSGTAYGNGETINIQQAASNGNLHVVMSIDGKGLTVPMELKNGVAQAVIKQGSPEYSLFAVEGQNITPKVEYVQVGRLNGSGGVSSVSTVVGNPSEVAVEVPVTTETTDIEITAIPQEAPEPTATDDFVPWVWPIGIVNDPNRAKRQESQGQDSSPEPSPEPVPDNSSGPDASEQDPSKELELRRGADIVESSSGGSEGQIERAEAPGSSASSQESSQDTLLKDAKELKKGNKYIIISSSEFEYEYKGYDENNKVFLFNRIDTGPGYIPLKLDAKSLEKAITKQRIKQIS